MVDSRQEELGCAYLRSLSEQHWLVLPARPNSTAFVVLEKEWEPGRSPSQQEFYSVVPSQRELMLAAVVAVVQAKCFAEARQLQPLSAQESALLAAQVQRSHSASTALFPQVLLARHSRSAWP